ncbi:AbrB/MazE/SpoVT family DNA-binding domain-containing protein [Paracraurococcus lichenis]|uniref:AbrB/MazE/SpoVT family DNA-binding domain-containing protein n=1 Tax=Paracraurococcus lichenis TaxID=3064888 RepID=A0ABT9E3V5_9PROT|nr:AbrB/MazE/SpoVT family DNA-binding domain-containing protein [Paracraurococcus sp. LOR1-02]MDO9710852.1 AbrB/MazE/SpoVT family DNA-binding domain-containing protein [Paracraurococcus sp. LOR1-02]
MATLKLRAIGNSVGVVLPKELLSRLDLQEGDTLHAVETPEGLTLSRLTPDQQEQLRIGREVMRKYRNVLRELAK